MFRTFYARNVETNRFASRKKKKKQRKEKQKEGEKNRSHMFPLKEKVQLHLAGASRRTRKKRSRRKLDLFEPCNFFSGNFFHLARKIRILRRVRDALYSDINVAEKTLENPAGSRAIFTSSCSVCNTRFVVVVTKSIQMGGMLLTRFSFQFWTRHLVSIVE